MGKIISRNGEYWDKERDSKGDVWHEWEAFLKIIPVEGQEKAEEVKERMEDFVSAQEKRAYIQGYVDCVQALWHMGLLKENKGLKWAERMDVH
jgi:hypothetical protein|nr:hypothetical protein [uncultured Acetatifactor sp.]